MKFFYTNTALYSYGTSPFQILPKLQPKQGGTRIATFSAVCQAQMKAVSQGHTVTPRKSRSGFVILTVAHMASPDGGHSVCSASCSAYLVASPVSPSQADIGRCRTLEIIHCAPWGGQPGLSQPLTAVRSSLLSSCHSWSSLVLI